MTKLSSVEQWFLERVEAGQVPRVDFQKEGRVRVRLKARGLISFDHVYREWNITRSGRHALGYEPKS